MDSYLSGISALDYLLDNLTLNVGGLHSFGYKNVSAPGRSLWSMLRSTEFLAVEGWGIQQCVCVFSKINKRSFYLMDRNRKFILQFSLKVFSGDIYSYICQETMWVLLMITKAVLGSI